MPVTRRLAVTRPGETATATLEKFDVVRAEEEDCRPVRLVRRAKADWAVREPDLTIGKRDVEAVGLADEAVDKRRDRVIVDLLGGADLLDHALAHHYDAVGKLECLFLVMGKEEGRVAGAVMDFAEPPAEFPENLRVQRAEGLVEQQHARFDRHGAGERHPLPLAKVIRRLKPSSNVLM